MFYGLSVYDLTETPKEPIHLKAIHNIVPLWIFYIHDRRENVTSKIVFISIDIR